MKQEIYMLIASDSHMSKEYDKVLSICDEFHIKVCAIKAMKDMGVSEIAAYIQSIDFEESNSLDEIYTKYNYEEDEFDEGSLIDEFTLRVVPVEMNKVESY